MKQLTTTENPPALRRGSREAIVSAAERLFLKRGFGSVSMDELAEEAGVARRTLYNQFASKEEILREMLFRVSTQLGSVLPPGIETQGDAEDVLRLFARAVLAFQAPPEFVGLVRMTVADARQFPWIATAFDSVLKPYLNRFERYLSHLTSLGVLDCPHPLLAAQQFLGLLNGLILWPRVLGQDSVSPSSPDIVIDETVQMFLLRYRPTQPRK
jgi:TetR/AcrR family transcriptional regulator of autoinduction and epiphytic fitness